MTKPTTPNLGGLEQLTVWADCLPDDLRERLLAQFDEDRFATRFRDGFPFYRTTFWYPAAREATHVVEEAIDALREAAQPSRQVIGVEWWFSVMRTNATPQWLLPCHFDRADLDEFDPERIRFPERASVFFFNTVPYGELVVTDQVLGSNGKPTPAEPHGMRFVPPADNRYAVFPGHLYHGVIGRMWRPEEDERLRVTMAVNWWTQRPSAAYLRDSSEAVAIFGLDAEIGL